MSVGVLRSSATKPDLADLLARARAIAELARERAQQTEATRRVGDDMIEHMRQADLFRVMQPRVYGGGWGGRPAGAPPSRPPATGVRCGPACALAPLLPHP